MTGPIKIETTQEVADALASGQPVVALEIHHHHPWHALAGQP